MLIEFNRLICALILFLLVGCGLDAKNEPPALVPLEGLVVKRLFLGKPIHNAAERCAYAVKVIDAVRACRDHQCDVQAFLGEIKPITNSQRAILVTDCATNNEWRAGQLLADGTTGDHTNIHFFLMDIDLQDGLWQQAFDDEGNYEIWFFTEASDGTLSFKNGHYGWDESPP